MTDMITAKGKAANKEVLNSELGCCYRLMKRLSSEARETVIKPAENKKIN